MSIEGKWPELGLEELVEGLTVCSTVGAGCIGCQLEGCGDSDLECANELNRQAAGVIWRLAEENRKLREATEGYVGELAKQMADLARECNTAQERGLTGVAGDYVLALNQIQAKLLELGRVSVVRTVPGADGSGWTVLGIGVEGRVVFGEMLNAECKMQNEGTGDG